jgi:hypothetical protein
LRQFSARCTETETERETTRILSIKEYTVDNYKAEEYSVTEKKVGIYLFVVHYFDLLKATTEERVWSTLVRSVTDPSSSLWIKSP